VSELAALRVEHEVVEGLARELGRIVLRPLPPAPAALERIRREFVVELKRHLRHEDAVLYPRLLQSDDGHVRVAARQFIDEAGGLARQFEAFCKRWDRASIVADWSGFCDATLALLRLLEHRIATEEFTLYPMFAREIGGKGLNQAA
jgi:hemerythrin-like domain-containing protein